MEADGAGVLLWDWRLRAGKGVGDGRGVRQPFISVYGLAAWGRGEGEGEKGKRVPGGGCCSVGLPLAVRYRALVVCRGGKGTGGVRF